MTRSGDGAAGAQGPALGAAGGRGMDVVGHLNLLAGQSPVRFQHPFRGVGIAIAADNSWKYRASTIDAASQKIIADAAGNEAAKIVAGAFTSEFGEAKVDLDSPAIKAAVANIIGADAANLKAALVATGATPDRIASLVLGAVGAAQIKIVGGPAPGARAAHTA